jgi:hypothetical protein
VRNAKPLTTDAATGKGEEKAAVPVSDAARDAVGSGTIRAFISPPTREQLMAGSANLRRVYKVEG